jgi:hypothetical protein
MASMKGRRSHLQPSRATPLHKSPAEPVRKRRSGGHAAGCSNEMRSPLYGEVLPGSGPVVDSGSTPTSWSS